MEDNLNDCAPAVRTVSNGGCPAIRIVGGGGGKHGVISQTQTWTGSNAAGYDYMMSDIVEGTIPQAFIDIVSAFGVVFNEETGYFEIDTLTDISYQEMLAIYAATGGSAKLGIQKVDLPNYKGVRAVLPIRDTNTASSLSYQFTNGDWELIIVQGNQSITAVGSAFGANPKLRKISGCSINQTSGSVVINGAYSLEELYFRGIKINFSVPNSSRLSVASVLYMIQNEASTSAITITLHATAYARALTDADVQAALAAHPNVSLASA